MKAPPITTERDAAIDVRDALNIVEDMSGHLPAYLKKKVGSDIERITFYLRQAQLKLDKISSPPKV